MIVFLSFGDESAADSQIFNTVPYHLTLDDEIITELVNAVRLKPEEDLLHLKLASVLFHKKGKLDEAIAEYRKAMRLIPDDVELPLILACHLVLNNRLDEAISEVRESLRDSKNADHHTFLGSLLQKKGETHAAFKEFRQAFLLTNECCDSISLRVIAGFLHATGKPEDGIAVFRERIRSHPEEIFAITHLGEIFRSQGKLDEESAVYREAIRLKPDVSKVHGLFAKVLKQQGKLDEARVESEKETTLLREAIRRNPDDAQAHENYAEALFDRGMWVEALKESHEALRIAPSSNPFSYFGYRFFYEGKVAQAIALFREAGRLKPDDDDARNRLGLYLLEFGEADPAVSEIRGALRMKPKNAYYLDSLGWALLARGELKEALASLREAIRLQGEQPDTKIQTHLHHVERLATIEGRLEAILRGKDVPVDADGRLDVAELCRVTSRFASAARFYREAFQAKPALADDLESQHRLHAAIAAAQAGTSPKPATDAPPLDDAERARWRGQALDWLRAEKDACAKIVKPPVAGAVSAGTTGPTLALGRKTLDILTHHRDLACVRDEKEPAKLPELERKEWQAFWAEVAALLKNADIN